MGLGTVTLVGAGPGSPDLITLRGRRALERATLIVADYLVPESFLDDLGIHTSGKEIEYLEPGSRRKSQAEINALLLRAAHAGHAVVRLKCGDPFVFGRGAEEAAFLAAEGIPFEVVPGLSAYAGAAAAGLPLTSRRAGRSFAIVTARCAGGAVQEAFPRADTLVVFMGVSELPAVTERLLHDGWPSETPTALVERATLPWERRTRAQLGRIAETARQRGIGPPALLIVGAAADEASFPRRPRILYTGLDPSSFRLLGDVIHWPALRVVDNPEGRAALPGALSALESGSFGAVVFTSRVGVRSFFAVLDAYALDARVFAGTAVITSGAGTDRELRECGIRADAVPAEQGSAGILHAVRNGESVLLIQGTHAPASLESELARRGCRVTRLALHRVVANPALGRPLPDYDVIYFTSPSGVRAFADAYGPAVLGREVWCIGGVTLAEVERRGFAGKVVDPHVLADTDAAVAAV